MRSIHPVLSPSEELRPTSPRTDLFTLRSLTEVEESANFTGRLINGVDAVINVTGLAWDDMVDRRGTPTDDQGNPTDGTAPIGGIRAGLGGAYLVCRAFLGLGGVSSATVRAWLEVTGRRFDLTATTRLADRNPTAIASALSEYCNQRTLLDNAVSLLSLLVDDQVSGSRSPGGQAFAAALMNLADVAAGARAASPVVDAELRRWRGALGDVLASRDIPWDETTVCGFPRVWSSLLDQALDPTYHSPLSKALSDGARFGDVAEDRISDSFCRAAQFHGKLLACTIVSVSAPTVRTMVAVSDCRKEMPKVFDEDDLWSPALLSLKARHLLDLLNESMVRFLEAFVSLIAKGAITPSLVTESCRYMISLSIEAWRACTPSKAATKLLRLYTDLMVSIPRESKSPELPREIIEELRVIGA